MRINIVAGFFLPIPPVRGGATEKIWYTLGRRFAADGHTVNFISRSWPNFADDEVVDGVHHLRMTGADHTSALWRNVWLDFRWGRRVTRRLPAADVTICNTIALPIWLKRRRPDAGRVVSVMARMPKGQTRFYQSVDLVLALSAAVESAVVRENSTLAKRIVRFPFPIDWQRQADAAKRLRATSGEILRIGYIGRIHPEKGLHLLIAACNRLVDRPGLPPWELHLTGPTEIPAGGGGTAFVQSLMEAASPRLRARLHINPPDFTSAGLAERYAALDVFCYPSIAETGETFGVAVAEAMAAACAPVVSSLPCFEDLVTPRTTGLMFDHRAQNAVAQLEDALAQLTQNPELRNGLATRAQAHAAQFDFAVVANALERNLQQLLDSPVEKRPGNARTEP